MTVLRIIQAVIIVFYRSFAELSTIFKRSIKKRPEISGNGMFQALDAMPKLPISSYVADQARKSLT